MNDPAATRKCCMCGEEKLILIDYPAYSKSSQCKQCTSKINMQKRRANRLIDPKDHWKYKRFGLGARL